MVIRLDLSADAEARLLEEASASGKNPDHVVSELVEGRFAAGRPPHAPAGDAQAKREAARDWLMRFDAWVANRPSRGYVADDSRESIYSGRGE